MVGGRVIESALARVAGRLGVLTLVSERESERARGRRRRRSNQATTPTHTHTALSSFPSSPSPSLVRANPASSGTPVSQPLCRRGPRSPWLKHRVYTNNMRKQTQWIDMPPWPRQYHDAQQQGTFAFTTPSPKATRKHVGDPMVAIHHHHSTLKHTLPSDQHGKTRG